MKQMLSTIIMFLVLGVNAQTDLPQDYATGKVVYKQSFKVEKNISKETAYEMVQRWFENNPNQFKRLNANSSKSLTAGVNEKNFKNVEKLFSNENPVQSIDPESNRIAGKVITKYTGNPASLLKVMYLEYYLIVQVSDNRVDCEITDIRYNHFHPKTFALQRITNWGDFSSLEPINTIEYLRDNQKCAGDFCAFVTFMNDDVNQLCSNLGTFLKFNQSRSFNTAK